MIRCACRRHCRRQPGKILEAVRKLGADTVIDFQTQRFEEEVRDADAVIDLVGGERQTRSFQFLRRGGTLISAVSRPDQHLAQSHGLEAAFFLVNVTSQYLAEIASLIDGGTLRTRVGAVLPLADAREAHFMLEGVRPHPKGKIYLRSEQVERLNLRFVGNPENGSALSEVRSDYNNSHYWMPMSQNVRQVSASVA